jgi:hypothetical protein
MLKPSDIAMFQRRLDKKAPAPRAKPEPPEPPKGGGKGAPPPPSGKKAA